MKKILILSPHADDEILDAVAQFLIIQEKIMR